MANIAYFEIPADNVDRAKHFYKNLLGWKIKPAEGTSMDQKKLAAIEYHEIITGEARDGTMNMGGMYKRQMNEPIKSYVIVEDLDNVLSNVVKLGGKIVMPKEAIKGVGHVAIILDTEGNGIGLWKPGMP
jgi:predicted enzyme related to lactoylglutathione lyase